MGFGTSVHVWICVCMFACSKHVCECVYMCVCVCTCLFSEHHNALRIDSSIAVCCSVLRCVAVCRSVLQCDAVCCSVLTSCTTQQIEKINKDKSSSTDFWIHCASHIYTYMYHPTYTHTCTSNKCTLVVLWDTPHKWLTFENFI